MDFCLGNLLVFFLVITDFFLKSNFAIFENILCFTNPLFRSWWCSNSEVEVRANCDRILANFEHEIATEIKLCVAEFEALESGQNKEAKSQTFFMSKIFQKKIWAEFFINKFFLNIFMWPIIHFQPKICLFFASKGFSHTLLG